MKHLLGIPIFDRKEVSYLGRTLDSIEAAGGWSEEDRFLYADGAYNQGDTRDWTVLENVHKGASLSRWRTMQEALARGCDQLTIFEDDIILCRRATEVIRRTVVPPNVAFISWFTTMPGRGLLRCVLDNSFLGAQAMTFTMPMLRRMLTIARYVPGENAPDTRMKMASMTLGLKQYAACCPSLVQHVGLVSGWSRQPLSERKAALVSTTFDPELDARDVELT